MEPNYAELLRQQFSEPSPDRLRAMEEYPVGSLVYLTEVGQIGEVVEHSDSQDGVLLKIDGMGRVPIGEVRKLTEEELKKYSS